jgi:hypothetical protein
VLLAELLLRVAQMGLRLLGNDSTGRADLSLGRGQGLAGQLGDGSGHARNPPVGRSSTELLDPRGDPALVLTGLLQVLLKPLLVRRLLGQGNVRRKVGF